VSPVPTVSISPAKEFWKSGDELTFNVDIIDNFNVSESNPPKITIGSFESEQPMSFVSNTECTFDWTVPDDIESDNNLMIIIDIVDEAGNSSTVTNGIAVIRIDNDKPELDNSSVDIGEDLFFRGGETGTISFEILEANLLSTLNPPVITIQNTNPSGNDVNLPGGGVAAVPVPADDIYAFTYDWEVPSGPEWDGVYQINLSVTDSAGNVLEVINLTGDSIVIDNTPPTASLIAFVPENGTYLTNSDQVSYQITFVEANGFIEDFIEADIDLEADAGITDEVVTLIASDNQPNLEWTLNIDLEGDGRVAAGVLPGSVTDRAGNALVAVETDTAFIIDNTSPQLISIADDQTDTLVKAGEEVLFTVKWSDENGIDPSTVMIELVGLDAPVEMGPAATDDTWEYLWTVPEGSDGSYEVVFTASDSATNQSTVSYKNYIIDNRFPEISFPLTYQGTDEFFRGGETVQFEISIEEINGFSVENFPRISIIGINPEIGEVALIDDGILTLISQSGNIANFGYEWDVPLSTSSDGSYQVDLLVADSVGNILDSEAILSNPIIIDNTAPTVMFRPKIDHPEELLTNADTIFYNIVFEEGNDIIDGFDISDIALNKDAEVIITSEFIKQEDTESTLEWTLVLPVSGDGSITPEIVVSDITDRAG
ncbi:MAG: Ig-like domain repeat protein, partial [Cyclobacteriaceae bacterium]